MTDDSTNDPQGFLHPMNRARSREELEKELANPDWEPRSFPPMEQVRPVPPSPEQREEEKKIRAWARKEWPLFSDFLNMVYQRYLEHAWWRGVFEPHKIVPPGGYHSPRNVPATLFAFIGEVIEKYHNQETVFPTQVSGMLLTYEILRYQCPIYYVSEQFARAVAATELPGDFMLGDLKWPMPAMIIGFPTRFMQEYIGRDSCYVYAGDLEQGDHAAPDCLAMVPGMHPSPRVYCPAKVCVQAFCWGEVMESFIVSWMKKDRLNELGTKYGYTDYTDAPATSVSADKELANKVGALVLKLILVLNTRPAYLQAGKLERKAKIKHGKVQKSELWSANMIGFTYLAQKLTKPVNGSHASPRYHWRAGHFTHQVIGGYRAPDFVSISVLPKIAEGDHRGEIDWASVPEATREAFWRSHKRVWLEPVLVNFEEPKSNEA